MPMPMMHQVFVLHVPHHQCSPPANISVGTLAMDEDVWREIFLPIEFSAYTYTNESSVCNYYSYGQQDLDYIRDNWQEIVDDTSVLGDLQVGQYSSRETSVVHSHWSRNVEARLSLVETFPSDACASNLMP